MRIVIKLLFKLIFGLMTVTLGLFMAAPATQGEARLFDGEPERVQLVQMRLANLMLDYFPEYAVGKFADATGTPPEIVRENLQLTAQGQSLGSDPVAENNTTRRIEAGGALFVQAD